MIEKLFLILLTNGAVLIVPGLNFAVLTRYVLNAGLFPGILCSLGITLAISIHVILSMLSSHQMINSMPILFRSIQVFGSLYIFYLATRLIFKSQINNKFLIMEEKSGSPLINGFIVDLLNPFVTLFYLSLFSSLVTNDTSFFEMSIYFVFIAFITFAWFFIVSFLFSRNILRQHFTKYRKFIECFSAIVLYYYAIQLILSR